MPATSSIRVDPTTHAKLKRLAESSTPATTIAALLKFMVDQLEYDRSEQFRRYQAANPDAVFGTPTEAGR